MTGPRVQLTVGRGQFPRTRIGVVRDYMQYATRVLHFSAFQRVNEYISFTTYIINFYRRQFYIKQKLLKLTLSQNANHIIWWMNAFSCSARPSARSAERSPESIERY